MDQNALPRKRVLIVEDSQDVRDVWHDWLTIWGFEVDEASNGAEAVARALSHRPDLVLMDWTLPVLGGMKATALLKSEKSTAEVPVLALSADTFAPTPQEAMEAGCEAFVGKPVSPERLLTEIRRAFDAARAQRTSAFRRKPRATQTWLPALAGRLRRPDVLRARTLRARAGLEVHCLTLTELVEPHVAARGRVEEILGSAPLIRRDEPEPLVVDQPLDRSSRHVETPPKGRVQQS
jgi:two-component system, cell cycle response regulator DivK